MAAALVLALVALWQTWRLDRLTPAGTPTTALVLSREMRRPVPDAPLAESVVTLLVTDLSGGGVTVVTSHPPASLVELWTGATVAVVLSGGDPPRIAYMPEVAARARRTSVIVLAIALGLAALFGLLSRLVRPR